MLLSNHTVKITSLHKVLSINREDPLLSMHSLHLNMGNIPKVRVSD